MSSWWWAEKPPETCRQPNHTSGRQQEIWQYPRLHIVLSSWWWAENPPETCRQPNHTSGRQQEIMTIPKAAHTVLWAPDDGRKNRPDNNKEHYKFNLAGYIKYTFRTPVDHATHFGLHVKSPIFLSGFYRIWTSTDSLSLQHQISRKSVHWEPRWCTWTDCQTGRS
jgi:hypothetical protein